MCALDRGLANLYILGHSLAIWVCVHTAAVRRKLANGSKNKKLAGKVLETEIAGNAQGTLGMQGVSHAGLQKGDVASKM